MAVSYWPGSFWSHGRFVFLATDFTRVRTGSVLDFPQDWSKHLAEISEFPIQISVQQSATTAVSADTKVAPFEEHEMTKLAGAKWAMDPQEVGDRIAIRECIDRFSLAMTQADAAAISPLFLPDGSWGSGAPFTFTITGAEAIGALIANNKTHFEFSVHMVHSVVIDLDGDQASARTVLQEITRTLDGKGGMTCQGIYHDKLQRTQSGWRFASRMFETVCLDRTPSTSQRVKS